MVIASYAHLRIEGSEAFIASIRRALDLLRPLPSWRYTAGLRRIAADNSSIGWYCANTKTCFIGQTVAFHRSPEDVASLIVHEGAHGLDPRQQRDSMQDYHDAEVVAFTAQLAALHELRGHPQQIAHIERCLANPTGHFEPALVLAIEQYFLRRNKATPEDKMSVFVLVLICSIAAGLVPVFAILLLKI